jgi:hypothetical protein
MSPLTVLGWLVRAPLVLAGAGIAGIVLWSHLVVLPTFTQDRYRHFWDDIVAHHLKADGHKSLDQLHAEYDPLFVRDCAVNHDFYQVAVPSEKAGLAFWVGSAMDDATGDPPQRSPYWIREGQAMFLFFVLPLLAFVRAVTRNLAWAVCWSERSAELFAERYEAPAWRRAVGAAVVLPVVVALSAVGAAQGLTPDLRRAGFTLVDLTTIAVAQSYLGGALVRFVRGVVDAGFLAAGADPDTTVWDDVLAVALTGPVLVLLYGNPPVGVLGDLAAGVGAPLVLKAWRRWQIACATGTLDAVMVPDGEAAVARNWLPAVGAALAGFCMLSCGGCGSFVLRNQPGGPTPVTATELESRPLRQNETWVMVDDGYLFWPMLTPIPDGNRPGRVGRYVVPLVSAATRDEWAAEARKGADARYRTAGHRPLASFDRKEFERLFPGVKPGEYDPERPWTAHRVAGRLQKLTDEPPSVRAEVKTGGAAEANVVQILDGQTSGFRPGMLPSFVAVGLVAMLPLPLRLLVTLFRPRRADRRRNRY